MWVFYAELSMFIVPDLGEPGEHMNLWRFESSFTQSTSPVATPVIEYIPTKAHSPA